MARRASLRQTDPMCRRTIGYKVAVGGNPAVIGNDEHGQRRLRSYPFDKPAVTCSSVSSVIITDQSASALRKALRRAILRPLHKVLGDAFSRLGLFLVLRTGPSGRIDLAGSAMHADSRRARSVPAKMLGQCPRMRCTRATLVKRLT
jgi:hypothetical protein